MSLVTTKLGLRVTSLWFVWLTWEANENQSQLTVPQNSSTLLVAIQVGLCLTTEMGMFGYCVSVEQRVNIMAASHTMGMWLVNKTTYFYHIKSRWKSQRRKAQVGNISSTGETKNKYGETSRSKTAQHSRNENHRIQWDKAKIIYKERNRTTTKVEDSMFLSLQQNGETMGPKREFHMTPIRDGMQRQ